MRQDPNSVGGCDLDDLDAHTYHGDFATEIAASLTDWNLLSTGSTPNHHTDQLQSDSYFPNIFHLQQYKTYYDLQTQGGSSSQYNVGHSVSSPVYDLNQSQPADLWEASQSIDELLTSFRDFNSLTSPELFSRLPSTKTSDCQPKTHTSCQQNEPGALFSDITEFPIPESPLTLQENNQVPRDPYWSASEIPQFSYPLFQSSTFASNQLLHNAQCQLGDNSKIINQDSSSNNMAAKDDPTGKVWPTSIRKFSSFLDNVTPHHACVYLVECLKDYHEQIPLRDLFNLIYIENNMKVIRPTQKTPPERYVPHGIYVRKINRMGLDFCRLIFDSFRNQHYARYITSGKTYHAGPPSADLGEISQNLLAIKILLSSFRRCSDGLVGKVCIPKKSLYKIYFITCHTLLHRLPANSPYTSADIIMSTSRLGRVAKLIFPNLRHKTVGRRGNSKLYYIGLTWNSDVVDQNIRRLLELSITQIKHHFINFKGNSTPPKQQPTLEPIIVSEPSLPEGNCRSSVARPPHMALATSTQTSYSFFGISSKFPQSNCSPRVWRVTPNTLPMQSQWAWTKMQKSMTNLKPYGVDMAPFIEEFNSGDFSHDGHESLSKSIGSQINRLQEVLAPREAYLHLYFVVLVVIFPVVMASNIEVNASLKNDFRLAVTDLISKLEAKIANFTCTDETSLKTFIAILRRMIHVSKVTQCEITPPYTERVVEEMMSHLETIIVSKKKESGEKSISEKLFFRSIVLAMHSYGFQLVDPTPPKSSVVLAQTIGSIAKVFNQAVTKDFSEIIQYAASQESGSVLPASPFHMLVVVFQNLHDIVLTNPLVSKLPMVAVRFIICEFTNSVQYAGLDVFRKSDASFVKEFFKCGWSFSVMYQDYLKILSEVVALGETLSTFSSVERMPNSNASFR